jgi:hypothetical protein
MLRSLAEDQEIVWKQAFAGIETQGRFSCTPSEISRDLDGMILEAEMTRDSVSASKIFCCCTAHPQPTLDRYASRLAPETSEPRGGRGWPTTSE